MLADSARLEALAETGLLDSEQEESFDRFTRLVGRMLDVPIALVSLVDEGREFFKSALGLPEPLATKREVPLTCSLASYVVLGDRPLVVADVATDELLRGHPLVAELDVGAFAGIPLRPTGSSSLGALCAIDRRPRDWTDDEITSLSDLAAAVTSEIALRSAAVRQQAAREIAERAGQRLEYLAESSALLASSLDYEPTLEAVARLAVPTFADWCLVHLRHADGTLTRAALSGPEPEMEHRVRQRHTRQPSDFPPSPVGPAHVAESGVAELVNDVSDEMLRALARDEQQLAELRRLGIRSLVMAPLVAREERIGVMTFVSTSPWRVYAQEDLRFLGDLARRCAAAIDNARVYQERDRVARVLQATLLPPKLPAVDGLEVGARYHPFGTGAEVGGDFYDVFELGQGRWMLLIGDVCGKGARAAAVTGLVRHTLRAAAVRQTSPSALLATLNEVLLVETDDQDAERFCTVACLRVEPGPSSATVTAACGGHPYPVLVHADGTARSLRCEGTALGLFEEAPTTEVEIVLGPGELVVLFTDGVTEARAAADGELYGTGRVERLLASCHGLSAQEAADRLGEAVLEWQGGSGRDDVAILALRVRP